MSFLISKLVLPIYIDRQLIPSSPFLYLLFGFGLTRINFKLFRYFILSVILGTVGFSLLNYYSGKLTSPFWHHIGVPSIKRNIKSPVQYVKRNFKEGDIIVHTHPFTEKPFRFYWGEEKNKVPHYWAIMDPDISRGWKKVFMGYISLSDFDKKSLNRKKISQSQFKRIWLIAPDWEEMREMDPYSRKVKEFLQNYYTLKRERWCGSFYVALFEKRRIPF
jgi:hypothetical protein